MKIGYPCINQTIGCSANKSFKLASYTKQKLYSTIENNLSCLKKILAYNVDHHLLFFRISSNLIPFAAHPLCKTPWAIDFKKKFQSIGNFIKKHAIRISMHPDQFVLLNAINTNIVTTSIQELLYHTQILDLLGLDHTAKIQIHVGGVYGDKEASIKRFITIYQQLPSTLKKRLVIENDDYRYSLADCLTIHKQTKIPIVFDTFHHECLNNNEPLTQAITLVTKTWKKTDGIPMLDYSSQDPTKRKGAHAQTINLAHFKKFFNQAPHHNFDIMLEIKDKEKSALKAINLIKAP